MRVCGAFLLSLLAPVAWLPAQNLKGAAILSGMVALEDGQAPTEPVEILLVCSGAVRQRTMSQMKGQFSLQLADNKSGLTGMIETAGSASGGFKDFNQIGRGLGDDGSWGTGRTTETGRINLSDCEVTARLPGFVSEVVYLGVRDILATPHIGTLVLHRNQKLQGTTVSLTTLHASPKARKAYERGRKELMSRRPDLQRAASKLEKAVRLEPEFAAAWHYLGVVRLTLSEEVDALHAFQRSIAAERDYLSPYLGTADILMRWGRYAEAEDWSRRVIERNPEVTRAHYVNAFANSALGRTEEAEERIRSVQTSRDADSFPGSHFLLGTILARKGDLPGAADEYRRFLSLNPTYPEAERLRAELAHWETRGLIQPRKP